MYAIFKECESNSRKLEPNAENFANIKKFRRIFGWFNIIRENG